MKDESIDLIYLDPPFNSKREFSAPIGSDAAGAAFKDTWTLDDIDIAWWGEIAEVNEKLYKILDASGQMGGDDLKSYLIYMAVRIIEMHRILKPTGAMYLHCDPTMSHYLKLITDSIFGIMNFRNEINWKRATGAKIKNTSKKTLAKSSDIILFYAKSNKHSLNPVHVIPENYEKNFPHNDERGKFKTAQLVGGPAALAKMGKNQFYAYKGYNPKYGWFYIKKELERLDAEGKIYWGRKGTPRRKIYFHEWPGIEIGSLWDDINMITATSGEKLGYPTQKPLALLERIIQVSSNNDDIILDPFCGCATACHAASRLNRKWIGIDISPKAADLIKRRINRDVDVVLAGGVIHRTDIPKQAPQKSPCLKNTLYGSQEGNCRGCKYHFPIRNLTEDHIIPRSKGGQDDDGNIQLLCGNCNSIKGDRDMAYLRARLKELDGE